MVDKELPEKLSTGTEASTENSGAVATTEQVLSKRQFLSDIFTIFCAGFTLISHRYQNNLV
jgi:hypothetical protein